MEYLIIAIVSFVISALTLFSGFGLGTVLTPVFTVFFPVTQAISLTAIVHFLNNLVKFVILKKYTCPEVIINFGLPAVIFAFAGAHLLSEIGKSHHFVTYIILDHTFKTELINIIVGSIIIFFALFQIFPSLNKKRFDKKFLPLGGVLSGFFGGLSGNQGAFRSIFLLKMNLPKEQFLASSAVTACLVDITRLSVYGADFLKIEHDYLILLTAVISAMAGSYFASKILKKVEIELIKYLIFALLIFISIALILGIK